MASKAHKMDPKRCPPEPKHGPTWGQRCSTSRPRTPNMASLGPKVLNITARNPKTLRPSLPRAPKREPTVSKIHASGRLRGAITETPAKPLHNDTPCVLGRHASRRPPHTGKSSQACFVRTDHTASSQGHPSHMPQPVHPISYAKAISLQHTSSSHPDHTSSN